MKKFLSLVLLGFLFAAPLKMQAQNALAMPLVAGDTMTNSGTVTKVLPQVTAGYNGIVIQPVLTKLSGTVAGTIVLYETIDGTNYKSTGDTLTLANQTTNTVIWHKLPPVGVKYKVIAGGGSSVSAVLKTWYLYRPYIVTRVL